MAAIERCSVSRNLAEFKVGMPMWGWNAEVTSTNLPTPLGTGRDRRGNRVDLCRLLELRDYVPRPMQGRIFGGVPVHEVLWASGVSMTNDDGFLQGDNEPAASVVIVGALVSALIFALASCILNKIIRFYPVLRHSVL